MLTRRRFSQFAASGVGLCQLGARRGSAQGLGTDYDVIIVGAGVSGLEAAQRLTALVSDPKILVLEARDRLGGRVWSQELSSIARDAELGAMHLPPRSSGGEDHLWATVENLGLNVETLPSGLSTLSPSMSSLTRRLAEESAGIVQLNSPVTQVYFREGLVGVSYQNLGFESSVTARRLIITVPPTVLSSGTIRITPELPAEKVHALRSVTALNAYSFSALFRQSDVRFKDGVDTWCREDGASGFRAFRRGPEQHVLVEAQFRAGRADALATQSESVISTLAMQGFAEAFESVPPVSSALYSFVVDWAEDPHSLGARFRVPDPDTSRILASPIQSTLFFAGDTTTWGDRMTGVPEAYASGERVADEVARSLGVELLGDPDPVVLKPL